MAIQNLAKGLVISWNKQIRHNFGEMFEILLEGRCFLNTRDCAFINQRRHTWAIAHFGINFLKGLRWKLWWTNMYSFDHLTCIWAPFIMPLCYCLFCFTFSVGIWLTINWNWIPTLRCFPWYSASNVTTFDDVVSEILLIDSQVFIVPYSRKFICKVSIRLLC